ncbi:thioesterase II family protein [Aquimarina muelleri]|nr:thioesterase domain-containing protein [Aquimarina muelleri]
MMKKQKEQINKSRLLSFPQNKMQLFLLHFAGGSCYSFDFLRSYINTDIDFIPLEIPGRGKRFKESPLKNKKEAIQDYVNQVKSLRNDQPYLIYGHSMGATLGLSVVNEMQKRGDLPLHLIVSGNPGPGIKELEVKQQRYLMNDSDFKKELRKLGGVPEEVLESEELYDFFGPIMRADFEILEKDDFSEEEIKIDAPIFALMGSEEEKKGRIENWKNFTSKSFSSQIFKGNHFFIHDYPKELAQIIIDRCTVAIVP